MIVGGMRLAIADGVAAIDPDAWDRLPTGPSPFCEHAFLAALETSGSVGPGTGWRPLIATVYDDRDELIAAAPAYVKEHSYGEYIFDWAWADAAHRSGLPYYPKIVVAAPFTPATGGRLLSADPEASELLARGLIEVARTVGASSVHWLFVAEAERELLTSCGYAARTTVQYHWRNRGWETFDAYLAAMRSKRRREIRRERRIVRDAGVEVRVADGPALGEPEWASLDRFYRRTSARKWGRPYLTPRFFDDIRATFAHRVQFTGAYRGDDLIGGALAFRRDDHVYGRYWGCDERLPQLHFETCFYAPIEHAIAEGVQVYEAGAQGEHKIARGFEPSPIYSAHWMAHPGLHAGVEGFLERERVHSERVIAGLSEHLPYRGSVE